VEEFNLSRANRLNICIIPGGGGQVHNFQFRPATLMVLVGLTLAAMVFSIGYAFYFYRVNGSFVDRSGKIEALKAANAALEAQAATFSSTMNDLENKLRRLGDLDNERLTLTDEIRIQLGLPRETPDNEVLSRLAAGVAWAGPPSGGPEDQEGGSRYLIRNLNLDLERLMALADQAELRLSLINEGLSGTSSILAATPTILPLNQPLSSRFGLRQSPFGGRNRSVDFHRGLDIPASYGTLIRAPADGTVLASGQSGSGYGLLMTIDHGYGLVTRYGHLESILVEAGQTVLRGQPIARSGNSGRSTGPHLHYEVLLGGVPTDPLELLAAVSPALSQEIKVLDQSDIRGPLPDDGANGP
jgi:murein DD-endopeptidase MepM/ murein hydrolase activator NlpD